MGYFAKSAVCAHCGRSDVGSYDRGWATVGTGQHVCHPNDDGPDCYTLVTVYRHPIPCADCPGLVISRYDAQGRPIQGWYDRWFNPT